MLPKPLSETTISLTGNRFFDAKAFSSDRAFVIGYRGRVFATTECRAHMAYHSYPESGGEVLRIASGAAAWKRAALGMRLFTWLRGVDFFDQDHGWIVGGFGTILRTQDGGRTWTPSVA